jgi:hypothetical protein
VTRYRFPGFHVFLHDAAARIGRPEAEAPARGITTLAALANLCAQAGEAGPEHAPAVLAKASEFRDQLHAAYEAAGLMLDATRRALGLTDPAAEPSRPAPAPGPRERGPEGAGGSPGRRTEDEGPQSSDEGILP